VEPLEFTSSGERVRLRRISRQVKSRFLTFYEGIKVDDFLKRQPMRTLILDIVLQNGIILCKITM
jgi:hypothetical protein